MAFVLPTFVLDINIWRHDTPTSDPPDVVTTGQLRGPQLNATMYSAENSFIGSMLLLLPALTDIRDDNGPLGSSDYVEAPAGSGRFYQCFEVDDVAKGFDNEHRFACLRKVTPWPQPIP